MIGQSLFLDTSFLIASQQEAHTFYERSRFLLGGFYKRDNVLFVHPLVFDEFWYVLKGLHKENTPGKMSRLLIDATNNVFNFHNFHLVKTSFLREDLLGALKLMQKSKLRPRDALIFIAMQKEGIKKIVSFDNDFDRVGGIERVF